MVRLQKGEGKKLFTSVLLLGVVLFSFYHFLAWNELRQGYTFNDPVLSLFHPKDVSTYTFLFTYLFAITGILLFAVRPMAFARLLQAYAIMTLLRMICLFLLPLEAPGEIIPLEDVFLKSTFYDGRPNLKDLFFSGHTAVLFLFAFLSEERWRKVLFVTGALIVGCLVMLQHVHYSIDVFAAPVGAYLAVRLQKSSDRFFGIDK